MEQRAHTSRAPSATRRSSPGSRSRSSRSACPSTASRSTSRLRRSRSSHPHTAAAKSIVLSGGGAKNPTLLRAIRERLPGRDVRVVNFGVFAPSCHEPAAMALFAARTMEGLPSSLPAVTGAREAAVLGSVTRF